MTDAWSVPIERAARAQNVDAERTGRQVHGRRQASAMHRFAVD
jgi:hypothetical protein